jgi:hypothetical protein
MTEGDNGRSPFKRLMVGALMALLLAASCTSDGGEAADGDPADGRTGDQAAVDRDGDSRQPTSPTEVDARSAGSGRWSDPESWEGGQAPTAGDHVVVQAGHSITVDVDADVDGMTLEGDLAFAPDASVTIGSTANIIVTGTLAMRPDAVDVDHIIEFLGVDEAAFLGDGMAPLDNDVGLWVVGGGQLDLEGSERRSWSSVLSGVEAGGSSVEVDDTTGWQVGDVVVLTPTGAPVAQNDPLATSDGFHETTIAGIDGATVTFTDPVERAHPKVADAYAGELMNLTRNVTIRGTEEGRSHVFVHADQNPQFVRWVLLDRLGVTEALGRYPLHFHHSGEGARGSLVEGVAVRDGGHHAFVPHESHGITMRDLVAYNTTGGAVFWWDEGDQTNDLVWEHVLAARSDDSSFYLGRGDNIAIRDAVSVGISDREGNVGGFEWENGAVGNWRAVELVAHNNNTRGVRVWQNSGIPQVIDGFVAYHNTGPAIEHGAYTNSYVYKNGHLIGNWDAGILLQAVSRSEEENEVLLPEITFENFVIDAGESAFGSPLQVAHSAIPAYQPVLFRDVVFEGDNAADQPLIDFVGSSRHQVRCVDCTLPDGRPIVRFQGLEEPEATWVEIVDEGSSRRIRPVEGDPGAAYDESADVWVADIDRPLPPTRGSGTGLTVEYFDDPELTEPVFATVYPAPIETLWELEGTPYYRIDTTDGAGARWTGQLEIEPDQGGTYTFETGSPGGTLLWLDGELIIDAADNDAFDAAAGIRRASVELEGGRRYDIKLETWDPVGRDYFIYWIAWTRPDGTSEILPTSQLYPADPAPDNEQVAASPPGR